MINVIYHESEINKVLAWKSKIQMTSKKGSFRNLTEQDYIDLINIFTDTFQLEEIATAGILIIRTEDIFPFLLVTMRELMPAILLLKFEKLTIDPRDNN